MALACSADSRAVPLLDTLWRGSSISSISVAAVVAGHSRAIKASRASLASFEPRISLITSSILDRDGETHQYVGAVARLAQQELRSPRHDFLAERDEGDQHILE